MPSLHGISRIVCALGGLAFVGCYSPYRSAPYSPYGPGIPVYNPQPVPYQPQFGPPVGSPTPVYPNGSFPPNGSTFGPGDPGGSFGGSQFNNGLQPSPDPLGGGTFPPSNNGGTFPPSNNGGFGSSPPSFDPSLPPPTGGGLVPNYGDPETLPIPGGGNTFEGNTTPFAPDGASFQRDTSNGSVGSIGGQQSSGIELTAHHPSMERTYPVATASGEETSLYGFDPVNYRWLKGIVDFDEQQKVWVLIYNPIPDSRDTYKGQITLINNGLLQHLQNNDVVLVEGQIDNTSRDPGTGKPQYRVKKLH